MKALYINKEGVVRYIPECPEEPRFRGLGDAAFSEHRWNIYKQALQAAKDSSIEVADQAQARELICYDLYGGPQVDIPWSVTVKSHSDKLFDLPEGYDVEVRAEWITGDADHKTMQDVAVITPSKEEPKQEEQSVTISDLRKIKGKPFYITSAGEFGVEVLVKKSNLIKAIERSAPTSVMNIINEPSRVVITSLKINWR